MLRNIFCNLCIFLCIFGAVQNTVGQTSVSDSAIRKMFVFSAIFYMFFTLHNARLCKLYTSKVAVLAMAKNCLDAQIQLDIIWQFLLTSFDESRLQYTLFRIAKSPNPQLDIIPIHTDQIQLDITT